MYLQHNNHCNNSIYSTKVKDLEKEFVVQIPLPGFEKEEINISVKENFLWVKADNAEQKFEKVFELSDKIVTDNISAEIRKGILNISLPKAAPSFREITIN